MSADQLTMPKSLDFVLPDWAADEFLPFTQGGERLNEIARDSGSTSESFEIAVAKLLLALESARSEAVSEAIESRTDVRACAYLLANNSQFAAGCVIDRRLIRALTRARPGLGRLNIANLMGAFFTHYDDLNVAKLEKFGQFVGGALANYSDKGLSVDQRLVLDNSKLLFSKGAPLALATAAVRTGKKLENMCSEMGLRNYSDGKFQRVSKFAYYIEQLREISVGEDHEILQYVVKPDVFQVSANDKQLFGHKILEILIDRSADSEISEPWRDVIIQIAGDPRVPPNSMKYMKWWSVLGEKRIAKMRGWLSRLDLKLFLEVLESSAKDANNLERERMFESRKVFMEGLIDQKLVKNSRLFLCDDDVRYLSNNFGSEKMPEYARVSSRDTSMIYLDVNGLHMIEGSHSFKVKVMDQLPDRTRVCDYTKKHYTNTELRDDIKREYTREYGSESGYLDKTHDQHLNWQHDLLDFLHRKGVKVREEDVLTPKRYREYRNKFGLRG